MFDSLKQFLLSVLVAFQSNPPLFLGVFLVALFLIWLKHRLIRYGVARSHRQNYAGWSVESKSGQRLHPTGIGHTDVLIMRPVKVIPLALFCLIFFGGGALFAASGGLEGARAWFVVAVGAVFSALSLWMIAFSFTRIIYDGETIEQRALFRAPVLVPLSRLSSVQPINKTIVGGVYLRFEDGQKVRVVPRMSGYRQLLDALAQKDPKLALMLRMIPRPQKGL